MTWTHCDKCKQKYTVRGGCEWVSGLCHICCVIKAKHKTTWGERNAHKIKPSEVSWKANRSKEVIAYGLERRANRTN